MSRVGLGSSRATAVWMHGEITVSLEMGTTAMSEQGPAQDLTEPWDTSCHTVVPCQGRMLWALGQEELVAWCLFYYSWDIPSLQPSRS